MTSPIGSVPVLELTTFSVDAEEQDGVRDGMRKPHTRGSLASYSLFVFGV